MRAGWQPCRNLGLGKSQFYDKEDKEPGNTLLPDPEEDICPSLQIKNAEPKTKIRNIYLFQLSSKLKVGQESRQSQNCSTHQNTPYRSYTGFLRLSDQKLVFWLNYQIQYCESINLIISIILKTKCMAAKSSSTKSFISSNYTFWVLSQHSATFLAKDTKYPISTQLTQLSQLSQKVKDCQKKRPLQSHSLIKIHLTGFILALYNLQIRS